MDNRWENRSVIVNLLQPIGFEIFEANNGQEGLEKAAQQKLDLIITDLEMPVMNGFTFIKNLRFNSDFQNVIIIVSSASVYDFHRQQALDVGGDDFLPKPVKAKELLLQLQNHLQLTWIYENREGLTAKNQGEIVIPPSSELVGLYQSVQRCDVAEIQEEIYRIQQLDAKYQVFAENILALADEFEIEAIASFIQSHISIS